MHAQDLRTAEDRLAATNRRLIDLQEAGIDIGGLAGQLAFAHRALAEGRTQEAITLCEELQVSARRLMDRQQRGRSATETALPVMKAEVQVAPVSATASASREALHESIRPGVSTAHLTDRITRVADERLHAALDPAMKELHGRLLTDLAELEQEAVRRLESDLDRRFKSLSAEPETVTLSHSAAERTAMEADTRMMGEHAVTRQAAQQAMELAQAAERQAGQANAAAEAARHEAAAGRSAAESAQRAAEDLRGAVASLTASVEAIGERLRASGPGQASAPGSADEAAEARLRSEIERQVHQATANAMHEAATSLRSLQETVTEAVQGVVVASLAESRAAVEEGVRTALAKAPSQDDLKRLATDLRADLAYELEKVAAEKGWVSFSEIQARFTDGIVAAKPEGGHATGFIRLEAALVEFVRQSQSQQSDFMRAIQSRIAQDADATRTMLTKALSKGGLSATGRHRRALSTQERPVSQAQADGHANVDVHANSIRHDDADAHAEAQPSTEEPPREETRSVIPQELARNGTEPLEARPVGSKRHGEPPLDPLSMSQQFRVLTEAARVPISEEPPRPSTEATHQSSAISAKWQSVPVVAEDATPPSATTIDGDTDRPLGTVVLTITSEDESRISHGSVLAPSDASAEPSTDVGLSSTPRPLTALDADTDDLSTRLASVPPQLSPAISASEIASILTDLARDDGSQRRPISATLSPRINPQVAAALASVNPVADTLPVGSASTISSNPTPPPATSEAIAGVLAAPAGPPSIDQEIRRLVTASVDTQLAATAAGITAAVDQALAKARSDQQQRIDEQLPQHLRTAVAVELESRRVVGEREIFDALRRQLPELLQEPEVRTRLLGMIAVEAVSNPGVLGELTGLRAFLRSEIEHATRATHESEPGLQPV